MKRRINNFRTIIPVLFALVFLLFGISQNAHAITPVSSVSLSIDKTSPQVIGTTVIFTGQAEGGTGSYEYQFRKKVGTTWTVVQSYSTANTWTWDTTNAAAGLYTAQVMARNAGSTAAYEVIKSISYTLKLPPATDATLTVDEVSPQIKGTKVTFTAGASGGTASYEYQFRTLFGTTWTTAQSYSATNTWAWDTSASQAGTYTVELRVRTAGTTVSYDVIRKMTYTVKLPPATDATMTVDAVSPQIKGAKVTFAAGASGGTGSYEYQFRSRYGTTWTTVQPYSATNTWTWDTSAIQAGTYTLELRVRTAGTTVSYDVIRTMTYTVKLPPATSATLTIDPVNLQINGTSFTFTAQGFGGTGNYEYQFRTKLGTTWATVQPYSSANTWTWDTTTAVPGTYTINVWVRNAGATNAYDVTKSITYTPLSVTLTPDITSPQVKGASITFTAQASGGSGVYEYQFWKMIGTTWKMGQNWSILSNWTWDTEAETAGIYSIKVYARNAKSTAFYEGHTTISHTLTQIEPSSVITSLTPSEVKAGARITIAGSGFGNEKGLSVLTIGGAPAGDILTWNDSEIQAVVHANAMTGPVTAKVDDKDGDKKKVVVLWDNENPQNVGIVPTDFGPVNSQILKDGKGGAIIAWEAYGPTGAINIFAQRLNSRGKTTWNSQVVLSAAGGGGQFFPQLVSDGHGGAIVVWEDYRGGNFGEYANIYAQRISASGSLVWGAGVKVCTAADAQEWPKIVSDGEEGAIIVWNDQRNGYYGQRKVYAQRISSNGVALWQTNGAEISTVSAFEYPEIVSDGSGGAIVVWKDYRNGASHFYAQKIDNTGTSRWTANGVPISSIAANSLARPMTDGAGGAIVGWTSSGGDVYAQRIDGAGVLQWGTEGTIVSSAPGTQSDLDMTTDGSGGAILTWEDTRTSSANRDIYAQRVNASGAVRWIADVPVSTAQYAQYEPKIISDDRGGAIITWYDYRNYNLMPNGVLQGVDVFAQRLNSEGAPLWLSDGEAISTARLHQMYPTIAADNSGGAIILWEDSRTGSGVQLYAQGISTGGKQ